MPRRLLSLATRQNQTRFAILRCAGAAHGKAAVRQAFADLFRAIPDLAFGPLFKAMPDLHGELKRWAETADGVLIAEGLAGQARQPPANSRPGAFKSGRVSVKNEGCVGGDQHSVELESELSRIDVGLEFA